ncbi:MAG: hypothetical protein ABW198_13825 [Pseudorhodoplanes sp.]
MSNSERTTFQPVELRISGQSEARLVLFDKKLVAVISLLNDDNEQFANHWYADAAFEGLEHMEDQTFESLQDVVYWVEKRLAH